MATFFIVLCRVFTSVILCQIVSGKVLLAVLVLAIVVWIIKGVFTTKEPFGKNGVLIYHDYEAEPGFWALNDSLFALSITCLNKAVLDNVLIEDKGWEIVSQIKAEPEGACLEYVKMTEERRNGIKIEYNLWWERKYSWLLQYDIVRLLFDKHYFDQMLNKAVQGDADAQTLIGCCYGHVGAQASDVVKHDDTKALEWWMKAAMQDHEFAMRELALYYWHKGNKEEAMKWYKGNPDLFVISQAAKQKLGHEVAEYETKEKQTSKKFEIIDELHAGDVIYEKLTLRLGCVRLKVLTEPIRVELDEKTTCWDFTAELLEKRLYKWNKENSNKELISVESFDDEDRYRNFRLCEQVANGRPQLYKNNPFELGQDETDYLIWPPFNIVK